MADFLKSNEKPQKRSDWWILIPFCIFAIALSILCAWGVLRG
jgi:hypothetical protein